MFRFGDPDFDPGAAGKREPAAVTVHRDVYQFL
jgi:hypothetical protein